MQDRSTDSLPSRQAGRRYLLEAGLGLVSMSLLSACRSAPPSNIRTAPEAVGLPRQQGLEARLGGVLKGDIDLMPRGHSYSNGAVLHPGEGEFFNGKNPFDPMQGHLVILTFDSAPVKPLTTSVDLFMSNGEPLWVDSLTEGRGGKILGKNLVRPDTTGLLAMSLYYRTASREQTAREAAVSGLTLFVETEGKVRGYVIKEKTPGTV